MSALLTKLNVMWVKFLPRVATRVRLTLTALSERILWEARGNDELPETRWTSEIGASAYDGMVNRKVNSCKPRHPQSDYSI